MNRSEKGVIGPWKKQKCLGKGGNGEVWLCKHVESDKTAAVKFLKEHITKGCEYQRFLNEIRLLQELRGLDGIMPIISWNLPSEEDATRVPWLAMPQARPLSKGFPGDTTVEEIVTAIARVADVLAVLGEKGIHHRDIKPANLFLLDGNVVLGDFGIATYPERNALTKEGRKLGPMWFIAPEMLDYRKDLDLSSADLYSLAKTLWVLLTGQRFPLPGEQRATEPLMQLGKYLDHPRTPILDRVLEAATRHDPKERISIADFSRELFSWANMSDKPPSGSGAWDVSHLEDRIRMALQPHQSREARRQNYAEIFKESKEKLAERLRLLGRDLPTIEGVSMSVGENMALRGTVGPDAKLSLPLEGPLISLCGPGKRKRPLLFMTLGLIDCGLEKTDLMAHIVVRIEGVTGPEIVWHNSAKVVLGGPSLETESRKLALGLKEHFPKALERYTELIESHRDAIE